MSRPRKVKSIPGRVVHVACGAKFTVAVTHTGAVYSWGLNHDGQLGLGKRRRLESGGASLRPQLVAMAAAARRGGYADDDDNDDDEDDADAKTERSIDFQDDLKGRGGCLFKRGGRGKREGQRERQRKRGRERERERETFIPRTRSVSSLSRLRTRWRRARMHTHRWAPPRARLM